VKIPVSLIFKKNEALNWCFSRNWYNAFSVNCQQKQAYRFLSWTHLCIILLPV